MPAMGTASSKSRDQQQRRRAQGIAVAQAEKKLEQGRRSPPGTVHRTIAPGTLSPIKTARGKSTKPGLTSRASDALGCSGRNAAKKKAALLPRPSSAGGLAVEVGGKQFVQAGEVRRREQIAGQATAALANAEREEEEAEAAAEVTAARAERRAMVAAMAPASLMPTPHRGPCANDLPDLRRPTPLAGPRSQVKEDEDREGAPAQGAPTPRSLNLRRLGPLAPLPGQQLRGPSPTNTGFSLPAPKVKPAPRGRRRPPTQSAAFAGDHTPPGGIPMDLSANSNRGSSPGGPPPVPSFGWIQLAHG